MSAIPALQSWDRNLPIRTNHTRNAFEGPIGVTDCSSGDSPCCEVERTCGTRDHWRRINQAVIDALRGITLAEMARPAAAPVEFRMKAKVTS